MAEISAQAVSQLREKTGLGLMQCKKALTETAGDIDKAVELLRKQGAAVAAKRSDKDAKEGKVLLGADASSVIAVEVNCETDFVAASDDFKGFTEKVVSVLLSQKPADLNALSAAKVDGTTFQEVNNALVGKIGEKISAKRFVIEPLAAGEIAETYSHMNGKIGVIVKLGYEGELQDKSGLSALAKDLAMQVAATAPVSIDPKDVPADVIAKEKEIYRELVAKEGKTGEMAEKIVEGRLGKFFKENCLNQQVYVRDNKVTIDKLLANTAKTLGLTTVKVLAFHRLQLGQ